MIAAAIAIALVVELAFYVMAGFWLHAAWHLSAWASALAAACAFAGLRTAAVGLQYSLARRVRPAASPALRACALVRAVLRETWATFLVYTWYQTWQRRLAPADPDTVEPGALPVLLVHGIYCNAGVWYRLLARLRAARVGNVFTLNLEPPLAGIDDFGRQLAARVAEVRRQCGTERILLVAHSMGGLVARAWIATDGAAAGVARLVTIATPHHGSTLARLGAGRCARDMTPGGAWLARLEAREARAPRVPAISIFSWHDNLVAPQDSALLEGARNVALERRGHLDMLLAPEVHRLVAGEIAAARGETPS